MAPVVIVPVYTVLPVRAEEGVNVAIVPEYVTVPFTTVDPCLSVKVADVIVAAFIASLNVTVALLLTATDVAFAAGAELSTFGAVTSARLAVVNVHEWLAL